VKDCPAETAAAALDYLAAHLATATDADRAQASAVLVNVPNVHPLRWIKVKDAMRDLVLDEANAIQHGRGDLPRTPVTAGELRAFAGRLREGAPEMRETGWYKTLHGGGE
jgi:hypothetical protein